MSQYVLLAFVQAFFIALITKASMYSNSDFFLIFFLFWLYFVATLSFAMILSPLFSSTSARVLRVRSQ